jgi:hypothetical protein
LYDTKLITITFVRSRKNLGRNSPLRRRLDLVVFAFGGSIRFLGLSGFALQPLPYVFTPILNYYFAFSYQSNSLEGSLGFSALSHPEG